jgi:subtilisin family serine protease
MSGPGRIVVAAAGNEGDAAQHAELRLGGGETARVPFSFPEHERVVDRPALLTLEGWFPAGNRYRFSLVNPGGQVMTRMVLGDFRHRVANARGEIRGWYAEDLGMTTLFLQIADTDHSPGASGVWSIDVEALEVGADTEIDFWIPTVQGFTGGSPRFTDHVDPEETVVAPASARRVIAVGAVATRSCWVDTRGRERCYTPPPEPGSVAPYSAIGPTADGRTKPEVLAPGLGVISARSATISEGVLTAEELAILSVPGQRYWVSHGTSMAAPQVTGTAALLLSRHPFLTPEQLVERLAARSDGVVDPRTRRTEVLLRSWDAVQPAVSLVLAQGVALPEGHRLEWLPGKEREPVRYLVHRAFDPLGPYHQITPAPLAGEARSFLDAAPEPGRVHYYRITAVDPRGLADDLDTLAVTESGMARTALLAPEPNPASGSATLRLLVAPGEGVGEVQVEVLDVAGRFLRTVARLDVDGEGGLVETTWDLRDEQGRRVAAGVYFVRLALRRTGGEGAVAVRRLVVLP